MQGGLALYVGPLARNSEKRYILTGFEKLAYSYAGADGLEGALSNTSATVRKADLKLAGQSFASLFSNKTGGVQNRKGSFLTGLALGLIGSGKMTSPTAGASRSRTSPRINPYTSNLL